MSNFVIDLREPPPQTPIGGEANKFEFEGTATQARRRPWRRIVIGAGVLLVSAALIFAVGGYLYWQSLESAPQYSLALLIDAARRDDQKTTGELVDIDAVVDDFLPQITTKAVELYGRGVPDETVAKITQLAAPVMPAVKDRAREELPKVIRDRTQKFQNIPFVVMVLGADRYLDIAVDGDTALVKSKMADRPFEVKMKKEGTRWRIVGVRDEQLATKIAQKVGQEIIAITSKGGLNSAGEKLGIKNLTDILRQAEDIFR